MAENKYQRGKIYKLISNQTEDVYYGSTIEVKITNRLSKHRCHYKRWLNGKSPYVSSFEIVKFDDAKILLVENFPCNTVYELYARENYYIENNRCVNKLKPPTGLTKAEYDKQYYDENKDEIMEKHKQYYDKNKDAIPENKRLYHEQNKDVIKEKHKRYYELNRDTMIEKQKQYYDQNKGAILEKQKQFYEENKDAIQQKKLL